MARKGVSFNDAAVTGYKAGDKIGAQVPTQSSSFLPQPSSISPTAVLTSASGTVKPRVIRSLPNASAAVAAPRTDAHRSSSAARPSAAASGHLVHSSAPPHHHPRTLVLSPNFLDRIDQRLPSTNVPIGLMPHQVAGYHRYLADLANSNSLAFKLRDLKVEDTKPFHSLVNASASPVRAPLAQPVAMQIDSDDEEEEPVPFIKDINVAGKSLQAANVRKFSGASDQDVSVYCKQFIFLVSTSSSRIHPSASILLSSGPLGPPLPLSNQL